MSCNEPCSPQPCESSCPTSSRQVTIGNTVVLEIDLTDMRGSRVNADEVPMVEIRNPNGVVVHQLSSHGVIRLSTGRYKFEYEVPTGSPTGVWIDHWRATVNCITLDANLQFIVYSAGGAIDAAGTQIGDAPLCQHSEAEICGINVLLAQLKCRLKNDVNAEVIDAYGNVQLQNCPIFTDDELLCFLKNSVSEFNQTPHFTNIGFDSPIIHDRNANIIVEGAYIMAIAAQMLVEAGREFTLTDNGITMQPPPLSTILSTQFTTFMTAHIEKLKYIKNSMKPAPVGFGTFRVLASNPNFMRLRHLRQRQIV